MVIIALSILVILAVLTAINQIIDRASELLEVFSILDIKYMPYDVDSCFRNWLSLDAYSLARFFMLAAPFLCVVAYAWSLAQEEKSGYLCTALTRIDRKNYYIAKYIAVFISGGSLIAIPLIINFAILVCFLPMYMPQIVTAHYAIDIESVFGHVFYNQPLLYVIGKTIFDFLLCGLWAVCILALSTVMKNRVTLLIIPYAFLLLLKHLGTKIMIMLRASGIEQVSSFTLFDQLPSMGDYFPALWWVTCLCMLFMFIFSIVVPWAARKRDVL